MQPSARMFGDALRLMPDVMRAQIRHRRAETDQL